MYLWGLNMKQEINFIVQESNEGNESRGKDEGKDGEVLRVVDWI